MGLGAFGYGIYSLATHAGFGIYFLLFGLAAIFLFSGASVLPTSHNNRSYIEKQLLNAVDEMEQYIKTYPDFPVPACYAHPVVLKRMQDILKEGRAETIPAALRVLKEDLKALNSSVVVEQEEYDEIVAHQTDVPCNGLQIKNKRKYRRRNVKKSLTFGRSVFLCIKISLSHRMN